MGFSKCDSCKQRRRNVKTLKSWAFKDKSLCVKCYPRIYELTKIVEDTLKEIPKQKTPELKPLSEITTYHISYSDDELFASEESLDECHLCSKREKYITNLTPTDFNIIEEIKLCTKCYCDTCKDIEEYEFEKK